MVRESRSFTIHSFQRDHRGLVSHLTNERQNRQVEHADLLGRRGKQLNQVRVSYNLQYVRQGYQKQEETWLVCHDLEIYLNQMLGRTFKLELVNQRLPLVRR